jgi:hypothetical protein
MHEHNINSPRAAPEKTVAVMAAIRADALTASPAVRDLG